MSSPSKELQVAILSELTGSAEVGEHIEDRIYDAAPPDAAFPFISFGPNDWSSTDDAQDLRGRVESLQIDVWSRKEGRLWQAREIVDAVCKALHRQPIALATHHLVEINARGRAFLDQDGLTAHGVVTIEAEIEEA